jgi:hypothetical protein
MRPPLPPIVGACSGALPHAKHTKANVTRQVFHEAKLVPRITVLRIKRWQPFSSARAKAQGIGITKVVTE